MAKRVRELPPAPARTEEPTGSQRRALRERAAAYANSELRSRGYTDVVSPGSLEWAVSTNAQRTRRVADIRPLDPAADTDRFRITLTWQYYAGLEWEAFAAAIRHELVHAVEYVEHGAFSHGPRFRRYAAEFDAVVELATVAPEVTSVVDHRYTLECTDCSFSGVRNKASAVVKRPGDRRCSDCGGPIRVRHAPSGRTWTTRREYREVRRDVEAAPDVSW